MKRYILALVAAVVVFAVNCSQPQSNSNEEVAADAQLAMEVDGMMCAVGCAKFIEKKVAELDGVSECEVNFENGIAKVAYSSSNVSEEDIVELVSSLNDGQYKVTNVEVKSSSKTSSPRSSSKEPNETEVRFQLPQLITYFMNRVIG